LKEHIATYYPSHESLALTRSILTVFDTGNGKVIPLLKHSATNFTPRHYVKNSHDSSDGIALGYGLDDRGSKIQFSAEAGNFSLHRVQNVSRVHPASYPMGTRNSFTGGKASGAWNWQLTSI
jgi:hypothetical protein